MDVGQQRPVPLQSQSPVSRTGGIRKWIPGGHIPTAPYNTKCSHLGCKNPRSKLNGFCLDHGGRESLSRDYDKVYDTKAWKQIRAAQLSKHPLCQGCLVEGKVTLAYAVDHVFPWRQFGEQAFRRNLFQSLCHGHHSRKTALEQRGEYLWYTEVEKTLTEADWPGALGAG